MVKFECILYWCFESFTKKSRKSIRMLNLILHHTNCHLQNIFVNTNRMKKKTSKFGLKREKKIKNNSGKRKIMVKIRTWNESEVFLRREGQIISFSLSLLFLLFWIFVCSSCTISLFSLLTDFSFLAGQHSPIIMIISLFDCLMPFDILPFNFLFIIVVCAFFSLLSHFEAQIILHFHKESIFLLFLKFYTLRKC